EIQAEFLKHFILPLAREPARRNDENFCDRAAKEKLFHQQTRHNGLARASIVSKQEADTEQRKEIAVNGFYLVRQNIESAGIDGKERIELVSDADSLCFCSE